jgi:peptidoglycan/LPS O-acetylase OafA/YrhL
MKRLECLDGLRGVLAVYVMLGHMAPFAVLPDWVQVGVSHGGAAVDVFFILSGLVITQSLYSSDGRAKPFLIARAARIFPVFLPVFALAVLVQPASCGFENMPWIGRDNAARTICVMAWPHDWFAEILAHLTMTHGLFPNGVLPDVWVSFLGAAWSLSTEWQFYVLALLTASAGPRKLGIGLLVLATAGLAWHWSVPESWQFSRAFLANKGHFFALGVASLALVQRRRGAVAAYCVTLAVCLVICASRDSLGKLLPPLVWTVCLLAQMHPGVAGLRRIAILLGSRPAQYFGAISYCLYLVNEPIHKLIAAGLSQLADGNAVLFTALWVPAAMLLPVLAAAWLHVYVERPGVRWGRSLAISRVAPVQAVARGL